MTQFDIFHFQIFIILIHFVLFSLALLASPITSKTLQELSKTFLELKLLKGHWHQSQYTPAIDSFNGLKHKTMKELSNHLVPGTPSIQINEIMGLPDAVLIVPSRIPDVTRDIFQYEQPIPLMPGIAMPLNSFDSKTRLNETGLALVYYWRNK